MEKDRRVIAYLFATLTVFVVGYFAVAQPELLGTQVVLAIGALMTTILALLGVQQRKTEKEPDEKVPREYVRPSLATLPERTRKALGRSGGDEGEASPDRPDRFIRRVRSHLLHG
jgi:hypothetical protein